ncbi:hypothetical protein KP509_06G008900 [Ceratopteris richardii]|nr:hypothetical protein KP509_06G008900 [Ceratopteris richardii]
MICPRSSVLLSGLPPAAGQLLQRFLSVAPHFAVDPSAENLQHHGQDGRDKLLRTPEFSFLGFASLLLGISSTLMLLGIFAFMVGFVLMPLILPASIFVCVGAVLPVSKEGSRPSASLTSCSIWKVKFLRKEAPY